MAVRIFKCHECGHHMRLSGELCGMCHSRKPAWERLGVVVPVLLGALALLAIVAYVA